MDILIQAHHPEAIAMRDITNSRVRFATQRLSRFVSRVVVRFTDLNGPRGGRGQTVSDSTQYCQWNCVGGVLTRSRVARYVGSLHFPHISVASSQIECAEE